jgi:hypothetical protein
MNRDAQQLAENAIEEVSKTLGIRLDPQLVTSYAGMLIGLVSSSAWKQAEAAGSAAEKKITNIDEAEEAARKRR